MLKKILMVLMALATTIPLWAWNVDGIEYSTSGNSVSVVSLPYYEKYTGSVTIPETVEYEGTTYTVKFISTEAFYGCDRLFRVTIPKSVTGIGSEAFGYCSNLENVTFADGDDAILLNSNVFKNAPIETLYLGRNITYNKDTQNTEKAFYEKYSLKKVIIGNQVTTIGNYAFYGCTDLTEVIIPNSVTSIGSYAFYNCEALTEITIPNSVTSIGKYAFYGCSGPTDLVIPTSVTSIAKDAFSSWSLKKVAVPSTATYSFDSSTAVIVYDPTDYLMENGVMYNSAKTQLLYVPMKQEGAFTVLGSITQIGYCALYKCRNITELIALPSTAPSTGDYCFDGMNFEIPFDLPAGSVKSYFTTGWWSLLRHAVCDGVECLVNSGGLYYVFDPKTSEAIFESAEDQKKIELSIPARVKLGDTRYDVTAIGSAACRGMTSLQNVTLGSNIEIIGDQAFRGCTALTSVSFPEKVTEIGSGAFYECKKLQSITLDEALITIDDIAFSYCTSLKEVALPDNLTNVGIGAFNGCSSLSKVTFPSGKVSLGLQAFSYTAIKDVDFKAEVMGRGCFAECAALTSANAECSEIGELAFYNCQSLKDIAFTGVENIGSSAFYNCYKIKAFDFTGVQNIGATAFCNCSGLTALDFAGVKSIGDDAFYGTKLKEVALPASIESIGKTPFNNCSNLTKIIIAESPQALSNAGDLGASSVSDLYIGRDLSTWNGTFNYSNLKTLVIGNNVTEIPEGAFKNCGKLNNLTLGSGLTSIGATAFSGCAGLTDVTIPASVTTIGNNAFENTSLKGKVAIGCGITEIGDRAFYGKNKPQSVCIAATKAPAASDNTFSAYDMPLYVPSESIDAYDVNAWSSFYDFADPLPLKEITSVKIEGETDMKDLKAGDTIELTASFEPADASLPYIFWRSTNPEVATVDTNGKVTFLGLGDDTECEIIAETMYANGLKASVDIKGTTSGIQLIINNDTIESVGMSVNAPAGIYNLQGICLRRTATDADVKALPAGIYIINGKKVVIR